MPIHFNAERWEKVRKSAELWWAGKLERPFVKVVVDNAYPSERPAPVAPLLDQSNCHEFNWSPEQVVDALDDWLCRQEYLGDAFPFIRFEKFGPGVLAAFCGARLDNSSGRVWFFPEEKLPLEQIHIHYDPSNRWVQRIKAIYRAGHERWNGNVLMSMPDLGGTLDVVATFCGSEELLYALVDEPEQVSRLCRETQDAWMQAYNDLNSVLQPLNPGYSDWGGMYSAKPSYILQSDFSYMISPDMFKEFVLPYLQESCRTLDNTIYHLDGIGQLAHLDYLLDIPELNAIQWVYGDGKPSARHWLDVYKKIAAAGKGIYLIGDCEEVCANVKASMYINGHAPTCEQGYESLKRLGVL